MEKAAMLQVVPYLVADGILALLYRFMERINRCGARRHGHAFAYRSLPVILYGSLPRQPVQEADPCSDGLDSQRAALAHLDDGGQQRRAPYHVAFQRRYRRRGH